MYGSSVMSSPQSMSVLAGALARLDGRHHGLRRDRQVADTYTDRRGDGIADRGGGGALGRLAGADRGKVGPVEDVHVDLRALAEAQDRVGLPVAAGDRAPVEADPFLQRPAGRLRRAARDLVADAVGVDH